MFLLGNVSVFEIESAPLQSYLSSFGFNKKPFSLMLPGESMHSGKSVPSITLMVVAKGLLDDDFARQLVFGFNGTINPNCTQYVSDLIRAIAASQNTPSADYYVPADSKGNRSLVQGSVQMGSYSLVHDLVKAEDQLDSLGSAVILDGAKNYFGKYDLFLMGVVSSQIKDRPDMLSETLATPDHNPLRNAFLADAKGLYGKL